MKLLLSPFKTLAGAVLGLGVITGGLLAGGALRAEEGLRTASLEVGAPATIVEKRATLATFPAKLKKKIKHVIILYPENRSFDSLYGSVPGANGLAQGLQSPAAQQLTATGGTIASPLLPSTSGIPGVTTGPDTRYPAGLDTTRPFADEPYVPIYGRTGDMVHRYYIEQYQLNNPKSRFANDPRNAGGAPNTKFSAWSDNGGLVMNHYDAQNYGEGVLARDFVICDNTFHSAFGGSYLNHQWLIAARTPVWVANPTGAANPQNNAVAAPGAVSTTVFDANGNPVLGAPGSGGGDGTLTNETVLAGFPLSNANQTLSAGDYWSVNTIQPITGPASGYSTTNTDLDNPTNPALFSSVPVNRRLPLQTYDTIGDRLDAANINWAWYSGGWNQAKAGFADTLFQYHHQPFAFFAHYALATSPVSPTAANPQAVAGTDSAGSKAHLKDEDADFYAALQDGSLPAVSFVKPIGENNSHPGYASVEQGQNWVANAIAQIQSSPIYQDCVVFVMYDEHGGQWDHVTPPTIDQWGPGLRIPFFVVSPFSKNGYVDHNQYETVSILAFIEQLFGLNPLNTRDRDALAPVAAFKGQPDLIIRGTAGQALSYQIPDFYPGVTSYKVNGPLNGLTLDPTTGLLTGTPKKAGSFGGRIVIRDGSPNKGRTRYVYRLDVQTAAQ